MYSVLFFRVLSKNTLYFILSGHSIFDFLWKSNFLKESIRLHHCFSVIYANKFFSILIPLLDQVSEFHATPYLWLTPVIFLPGQQWYNKCWREHWWKPSIIAKCWDIKKKTKKQKQKTRSYYTYLACHRRVLWGLFTVFGKDTFKIASGSFIWQILAIHIRTSFAL